MDAIGEADVIAVGFPGLDPAAFIAMFRRNMGGATDQIVTRIEFRHLPGTARIERLLNCSFEQSG